MRVESKAALGLLTSALMRHQADHHCGARAWSRFCAAHARQKLYAVHIRIYFLRERRCKNCLSCIPFSFGNTPRTSGRDWRGTEAAAATQARPRASAVRLALRMHNRVPWQRPRRSVCGPGRTT